MLQCRYYATAASHPRLNRCCAVVSAVPVGVQTATVDGAAVAQRSRDALGRRDGGAPARDAWRAKARAYILRRYKEAGIQPIGDSYERPFAFRGRGDSSDRNGVNIVGVVRGTSRAGPLHRRDRALRSPGRAQRPDLQRGRRQRVGRGRSPRGRGAGQRRQARALAGVRGARRGGVRAERCQGVPRRSAGPARRDRDEREHGYGRPRRQERAVRLGHVPVSVPQGVPQGRRPSAGDAASRARRHERQGKTTGRGTRTTIPFTRQAFPSSTLASRTKRSTTRRPTMPRR